MPGGCGDLGDPGDAEQADGRVAEGGHDRGVAGVAGAVVLAAGGVADPADCLDRPLRRASAARASGVARPASRLVAACTISSAISAPSMSRVSRRRRMTWAACGKSVLSPAAAARRKRRDGAAVAAVGVGVVRGDTHADAAQGRLPHHLLSSSRPPRLGHPAGVASRWLRCLDPATTRTDSACEERRGQTSGLPWPSVRYGRPEAPGGLRAASYRRQQRRRRLKWDRRRLRLPERCLGR
jgi:hypothetical protein